MLNNKGKIWHIKDDPPGASRLAEEAGISKLLASLLIHRGVSSPDSAKAFLFPRLRDLSDPFLIKDMDRAVELIAGFIKDRKKITIYGDYDVDGITAVALLVDFFSRLGVPISFYIPHRLEEGYGLNEKSIRDIASEGTRLLITVDCGINSIPEIVLAKKLGMEVIVTDHHQVPSDFEPICPTINPLRSDSSFYFRGLSGVGVAFYLAIGVRSYLRDEVYFSRETDEPDLKPYLDLVALGTVADVVPLIEENRILVKSGLRVLADSRRHGIRALFNISGINMGQTITSDDIAFKLAPRLNAIGRLDSATGAVKLLTTNNIEEASLIADHMESLNAQRQAIQDKILSSGKKMIEGIRDFQKQRTIVLFDPEWHLGVVGIVASKIAEEYYRPTFILGVKGGLIRGSGRSIDGFNLWEALSNLGDILEHFGGHYHAAGISFEHKNLEAFCERLEEFAEKGIDSGDMIPKIDIDALLNLDSINLKSLKEIEMLHPFGCQNPQPIFSSGPLQVISSRVVGNGHLKIKIKEKGIIFDCIAFRKAGLHPLDGKTVDAVFHLETNEWQGIESIQLVIVDIHVYPSP